jgi:hypothetical protein
MWQRGCLTHGSRERERERREEKKRKDRKEEIVAGRGHKQDIPVQVMPQVTYFFQLDTASYSPLSSELMNEVIH